MSTLIQTRISNGVGLLVLNRPRTINALNLEMFQSLFDTLHSWAEDDAVHSVEFGAVGDRGFSAGADVRELSGLITAREPWLKFLELEYALDALIARYPKPTSCHMRGITMGGGLGIAAKASRRTVDSSTLLAMPETKIGLFPDAGMMYQLARGGGVGTHLALTSATFGGGDALLLGIADESNEAELPTPLHEAASEWIDECYQGDDPAAIVQRLENHDAPQAQQAAAELRARSPFAVHVALRALRQASVLDQAEVLAQDLRLAETMVPIDFVEGVRALIVDKDNHPRWRHARIEEVPASLIDAAFDW